MKIPKGVILAGCANCAISFNIVNISLSIHVLRHLHDEASNEVSICASALLVGMILGQLLFGAMGDCLGRERALMYALLVCTVGALGSAFGLSSHQILSFDIFSQLAVWRFLLGIGGGGVYPLMAVIAKESVSKSSLDDMKASTAMAATFSMQGFGYILSPIVMLLLLQLPLSMDSNSNPTEFLWRMHLGIGALPLIAVTLLVLKELKNKELLDEHSLEQERFEATESGTVIVPLNEPSDDSGLEKFFRSIRDPNLVWILIGTALPWFLFDIMFYGNTLFVPQVLDAVMGQSKSTTYIQSECLDDLVIKAIALPGYIIAIFAIEKIGPKYLQLLGFLVMSAAYGAIGYLFDELPNYPYWALLLYSTTFLFSNLGPNSTTFIMPSTLFQEEVRSSMSGVSGAAGKLGAIIGTLAFDPLSKSNGIGTVLLICACISIISFFITLFFVPRTFSSVAELSLTTPPDFITQRAISLIQLRDFIKSKFGRLENESSGYEIVDRNGTRTIDQLTSNESFYFLGVKCMGYHQWWSPPEILCGSQVVRKNSSTMLIVKTAQSRADKCSYS